MAGSRRSRDSEPGERDILFDVDAPDVGHPNEADGETLSFGARGRSSHRWPARMSLHPVVLLGVLVVAGGVGFAIGHAGSDPGGADRATERAVVPASGAARSSSAAAAARELTDGPGRCSRQSGTTLQLGIELVNPTRSRLTLRAVQAVLPLGGLQLTATAIGSCGQLGGAEASTGYPVEPAASVWLVGTFVVRQRCPAPLPVRLVVTYREGGRDRATVINAFPDLGGVPYSGCTTPRS